MAPTAATLQSSWSPQPTQDAKLHVASLTPVPATAKRPRKARKWLRTREVERLQVYNLQLDVNNLQSEIRALRMARSLLHARALNRREDGDGSYVKLMIEYFSKMRHGYSEDPASHSQLTNARGFLHSLMDQSVRKGRLKGVEQFIFMLARYTEAFGPVLYQFDNATVQLNHERESDGEYVPGTVAVRVNARYSTSVIDKTFEIIFPHASHALRDAMIGQQLAGGGNFDIVFDARTHRVLRFDIQFDFIPAFARILRDPRDLAVLFSQALVTPDCCIGDLSGLDLEEPEPEPVAHTRPRPPSPAPSASSSPSPFSSPSSSSSSFSSSPSRTMDIRNLLN